MKSDIELKFLELLRKPIKSKEEIEEKERLRILFAEELHQEIKDLSRELKEAGSKFTDPWDMVNTEEPYPEAIDILIKHIPKKYHERNKEGIFRALAVKEAKGKANAALISEYSKIPKEKENLRWTIGNTIYFIVSSQDLESILSIVQNRQNGMSRDRFILALGKLKSEKAENVLIKLLDDDDDAVLSALTALGMLKSKKAKERINSFTNSSNKSIKKEAQKTLKKIE